MRVGRTRAPRSYDPFGTPEGAQMPDAFGYDGEWQDAATGLVDLRARWYTPTAGQFLSRDPLQEQTGQPYAYVADNPLNGSDPLGLQGCQGASGPQLSWQRFGSAIGDTLCDIGAAAHTVLQAGGALVAPPCDMLHGGCRPPTGQEVVNQAGRWTAAAGSAVGTVAHDVGTVVHAVGTAIRPNCWPGFQACRWETPQEAQQTVYGMAVGAYGALNTLTFGAEGAVGRWAGLRDVSCLPEYQQGARLGVVAAFFLPGGEEAALDEAAIAAAERGAARISTVEEGAAVDTAAAERGSRPLFGGAQRGTYVPKGSVLGQASRDTCTAISCLMLARDADLEGSNAAVRLLGENTVAEWLNTTPGVGASIERAPAALDQIANETGLTALRGYNYRTGMSIDDLATAVNSNGPAIVSVRVPGGGLHALVVDGIENGQVLIRDPSPGGALGGEAYSVPVAGFLADWEGRAVVAP